MKRVTCTLSRNKEVVNFIFVNFHVGDREGRLEFLYGCLLLEYALKKADTYSFGL